VVYEEQVACARGYRIIAGQSHPDSAEVKHYSDDFSSRGVDGPIMHAHVYPGPTKMMMEACSRFQHVVKYDKPEFVSDDLDFVDIDLESGMCKPGTCLKQAQRLIQIM